MMYKIYGYNDTFLYQAETKPTTMRNYEQYYITDADEKIINEIYNENSGKLYVDNESKEQKKQAPYKEKIDTTHKNYDYFYARSNASDGYGTIEEQLEYIAENGVMAFKKKQMEVKARYPKNES